MKIKGNGPLIIYRRGKWLEVFLMWGRGRGELLHCFQGNGGYRSSMTEVKGEAKDRKLTSSEEGS